jgi:2-oxoglutarate ferredoxin oxidoreductase subunit gamma
MIPAQEIAESIGPRRLLNMVMLGALLDKLPILKLEDIFTALEAHIPERHKRLLGTNIEALKLGAAFSRGELIIDKSKAAATQAAETVPPTSV